MMRQCDAMELLTRTVRQHNDDDGRGGQAIVARKIGYSAAAVNQALHGNYNGSLENLLARVVEVFGNQWVLCPVMGEVPLAICAGERRKPLAASSPQRVRLFTLCKRCAEYKRNTNGGK